MGLFGKIKHKRGPTLLALSRSSEIHWWHLGFLQIWATLVSVDAFQLSLFSFVYFPFAQSSPFSPRFLKLTLNFGVNRSYSIINHKICQKV